jgi:hypothetical protein
MHQIIISGYYNNSKHMHSQQEKGKKKAIHNYLKYVPSKKRKHLATNFENIIFVLAKVASLNCKAFWNIMILLANLQPKLNKCYVSNKHN